MPQAEALGIGPPSFEMDLQMDGSNSTTFYITSDGLEGQLIVGLEDLPFRVDPPKINMTSSDVNAAVMLTFYGNETLVPGVYEGKVTFLAYTGGFVAMGIKVRAKINLLGDIVEFKKTFEAVVYDFQVHPFATEVEDEEDVSVFRISYDVTNVGELEGNRSVDTKIDGKIADSNVFFLEAGETQSYLFEAELGVGKYEVTVEGFTESVEVCYEPKVTNYTPIVIGVVAAMAVAVLVVIWRRRS